MALLTSGATAILTPAQVAELVVRPVIEQAVSAQVSDRDSDRNARLEDSDRDSPIRRRAFVAEGAEIPATDGRRHGTDRHAEEVGRAEHHQPELAED